MISDKKIAINYITSWFLPDLISSFPFSIVELFNEGGNINVASTSSKIFRLLRIAKYMRLLRVVRFLKISKILVGVEEYLASE